MDPETYTLPKQHTPSLQGGAVDFTFGAFESSAHIRREIPGAGEIVDGFACESGGRFSGALIICDEHSAPVADCMCGGNKGEALPRCVLRSGESGKGWDAVESILRAAREAGLGRDGVFIGVGGGVVTDLSAFAASVYMRGCGLALVSTTLLGMVDAGLGGKTGFDLFGVKNLAGTFYPARHVYLPLESLASLPPPEWKSGMAELIKTAVLAGDDFLDELEALAAAFPSGAFDAGFPPDFALRLLEGDAGELSRSVSRAVEFKGRIVASDPRETGQERMLLNLGHTFAHALESSAGLGTVSHGEAVAWGLVRACELGLARGITPRSRAEKIRNLVTRYGYETAAPHPLMGGVETFLKALNDDKKKKSGTLTFIVPGAKSARPVSAASAPDMDTIQQILKGALSF
jgi:3-dehydroquinate synthase